MMTSETPRAMVARASQGRVGLLAAVAAAAAAEPVAPGWGFGGAGVEWATL
jgi:hypothetical protein